LREALELAKVTFIANKMDVRNVMEVINETLSATTSQSLQAHDNSNKTMAGACGGQAGSFRALKGKQ
jgi:hypothetical protein